MKTQVFAFVALVLAGCVTPFRSPSDLAHVQLAAVDSSIIDVQKIWLERNEGQLAVRGYVGRQKLGVDTARSHLDVTLFDKNDRVLRSSTVNFEPQSLERVHPRTGSYGSYRVVLDPLPSGTARIEVRAHEGPHPSS